ncbi:MAG: polysaccharide biosynthesis/export family protein [Steroidobacteraceae bacterium]
MLSSRLSLSGFLVLLLLICAGLPLRAQQPAATAKDVATVAGVLDVPAAPAELVAAGEYNTASEGYKLRPGDVLQISVWKETDLTAEVLIRPDGGMSFPLAGEFAAAGNTVADLTKMLEARIRRYIPDAVVTVAVKAASGNRLYVIGKVTRPGDFPLTGPIDVMQALTLAGGATPFADLNGIRVLRRDGEHQFSIRFRYGDVANGRHLDQNILLKNGDTVVVP